MKARPPYKIIEVRESILDYFARRKTPCRPHPAMLQQDLAALVKQGKLLKEVRREANPGPAAGVDYPKNIRMAYYVISEKERSARVP